MRKRWLWLVFLIGLMLPFQNLQAKDVLYEVKKGDSLSLIAQKFYDGQTWRWTDIYRENKDLIKNADVIEPGWTLTIPDAGEVKERLAPAKIPTIIKLVTGNDYPPFTDEELPSKGMITEIVREAFDRMGKPISIEWWAWKRGFDATEEGTFVATFPWLKNEERKKNFYYSRPLFDLTVMCYVKKDSDIVYKKREDLYGKRFCKEEGYYTHDIKDLIDSGRATLVKVEPKRVQDCFTKLENGEVDIVPLSELVAEGLFNKYGYKDTFTELPKPLHIDTLHLIFSKRDAYALRNLKIMYEFNQAIDDMIKDGTLSKIQKKHLRWHRKLSQ